MEKKRKVAPASQGKVKYYHLLIDLERIPAWYIDDYRNTVAVET
jgi:hypothetical protein